MKLPRRATWARLPGAAAFFRYRYLARFTLIGLASIAVELALVQFAFPKDWNWRGAALCGFLFGMALSFALNATLNFRVPFAHLRRAFAWFAVISSFSFALNMTLVGAGTALVGNAYPALRLASSGTLFAIAYSLHRRFTFDMARNFGIAVYASEREDVEQVYERVGACCDHVHIDLIDRTMSPTAPAVRLENIEAARRLWPGTPVALHVMSRSPRGWVEQIWDQVDWVLVHLEAGEEIGPLLAESRRRGKRFGVVWREGDSFSKMSPYLAHIDFAMVLGIPEPGRSGQPLSPAAVEVARMLDRMRRRYRYEVMFDGGVNENTVAQIPARYVVAASGVLLADNPPLAANRLRSAPFERRAA